LPKFIVKRLIEIKSIKLIKRGELMRLKSVAGAYNLLEYHVFCNK
jgi:hypothetical protein